MKNLYMDKLSYFFCGVCAYAFVFLLIATMVTLAGAFFTFGELLMTSAWNMLCG